MPRYRSWMRHLRTSAGAGALAAAIAILAGFVAPTAGSAAEPNVTVTVRAVWHASVNGWPVTVALQSPGSAPATIGPDGSIRIPKDGIVLTTDVQDPEPVPGAAIGTVELLAERDFTGSLDRATGAITLDGDVIAYLSGFGLENCPLGPMPVTLSTANAHGRAFDPNVGSASVATGPEFALPAIAEHAPGCGDQASWLNLGLSLAAPGTSSLQFDIGFPNGTAGPPPPPPPPPVTSAPVPASPPATVAGAAASAPARTTSAARAARPSAREKRAKRATTATTGARAATTAAATTTTTTHAWPTDEQVPVPPLRTQQSPPTTSDRTPIAAQFPVPDPEREHTSLGIGVLIGSLAAGVVGIALLRTEGKRLLRRKRRAAF